MAWNAQIPPPPPPPNYAPPPERQRNPFTSGFLGCLGVGAAIVLVIAALSASHSSRLPGEPAPASFSPSPRRPTPLSVEAAQMRAFADVFYANRRAFLGDVRAFVTSDHRDDAVFREAARLLAAEVDKDDAALSTLPLPDPPRAALQPMLQADVRLRDDLAGVVSKRLRYTTQVDAQLADDLLAIRSTYDSFNSSFSFYLGLYGVPDSPTPAATP